MKIILPPHLKIADPVVKPQEIIAEALTIEEAIINKEIYTLGSKFDDCYAVAQPQVSDTPNRYFVINPDKKELVKAFGGCIVVNPILLSKDKFSRMMNPEGCLSYPFRPMKKVKRFTKITVAYDIIDNKGRISTITNKLLENIPAIVFQHELQHLNGNSIWK